jgi:hypothetical protein
MPYATPHDHVYRTREGALPPRGRPAARWCRPRSRYAAVVGVPGCDVIPPGAVVRVAGQAWCGNRRAARRPGRPRSDRQAPARPPAEHELAVAGRVPPSLLVDVLTVLVGVNLRVQNRASNASRSRSSPLTESPRRGARRAQPGRLAHPRGRGDRVVTACEGDQAEQKRGQGLGDGGAQPVAELRALNQEDPDRTTSRCTAR